jgi:hypothetical protein
MILRHSLPTNHNPDTGIAYGYISANALDPDIVDELQMDGTDVYYEPALDDYQQDLSINPVLQDEACEDAGTKRDDLNENELRAQALAYIRGRWSGSKWEQEFNDSYQPDEPVHEGEKDGVKYRTSWLGGALNVWVFESPHITETAVQCSPCVPGAGNLDQVGEGHYQCYDVPPNWRRKED